MDTINVAIKSDLYMQIEEIIENTEFETVSEYVNYVLEEMTKPIIENSYSSEHEEQIRNRLKELGYLD